MPTQLEIIHAWDEMADDWDDMAAGSAQGFYRLLQKHISLQSDMTVLDFGCGTGLVADLLRHRVTKVVAVDVSPVMVEIFEEKMQAQEWENVQVFHALLGDHDDEETQQILNEYEGQIDLIIAHSVLGFVTPETVGTTMEVLGRLLKPGGSFCHTDSSQEEQRNHFTRQKAEIYYKEGGLETVSTSVERLDLGQGQSCDVFFGIARKPL
ncbi:hypothetical protein FisN_22Hh027 [Fistulifera solaris]|jgi:cyclopropane fatty-acyl-phospholipid synthase-like methyltransferase|uniref:Methyltransferase type 12 domain-containing protein n=1 Tax=Fistulifera solaris TaxID=1519565 RepID=A0A1Z5K2P6_FISSO|nr:hypothetical protein FisN_22Hh027 [Fistulifera solaris]|eukprot:GAX20459.1 hypothetical protein FisN_22Hh027 [Fistulifera solaris]